MYQCPLTICRSIKERKHRKKKQIRMMWLLKYCVLFMLAGIVCPSRGVFHIGDVCPNTAFCSENQQNRDQHQHEQACCFHCSCHEYCVRVGSCCHDAIKANSSSSVVRCKTQKYIYKKYLSKSSFSTPNIRVRVVTICLQNASNVSSEAISRCQKAGAIEDLVFVTSKESGVTYLNRHCAICNKENEFIVWNLFMVSSNIDVIFSEEASYGTRDEFLLRTGSVMSLPPTEWTARATLCYSAITETCNATGLWGTYEKDLEEKCQKYKSYYYDSDGQILYKNPFCFLCNSPTEVKIDTGDCTYSAKNLFQFRSEMPDFTALITTSRKVERVKEIKARKCRFGETFDYFSRSCKKLLCPPGTIIDGNDCEPLFEKDAGIVITISFLVNFDKPIEPTQIDNNLLQETRHELMERVNEYGTQCDFCTSGFVRTSDEKTGIFINFRSSEGCRYLQLLKSLSLVCRTFPIKLYSVIVQRNMSLHGSRLDVKDTLAYDHNGVCSTALQFNETMVPCPSIIINITDIEEQTIDVRIKNKILDKGTPINHGCLRICVHDYNELYTLSSSFGNMAFNLCFVRLICLLLLTFRWLSAKLCLA